MKWFKFYGQDWLTDGKIIRMTLEDRLCFITLLCLASANEDGTIRGYDEDSIIQLTHLWQDSAYEDSPGYKALGCLKRFSDNGMITIDNADDNNACVITIKNFIKRQETNLTGYERVKKYRQKKKTDTEPIKTNKVIIDNKMITLEQNRTDKNRIDNNKQLVSEITKWVQQLPGSIEKPEAWTKSLIAKYGESKVSAAFERMNQDNNPSPAKMALVLKEGK